MKNLPCIDCDDIRHCEESSQSSAELRAEVRPSPSLAVAGAFEPEPFSHRALRHLLVDAVNDGHFGDARAWMIRIHKGCSDSPTRPKISFLFNVQ